LVFFYLHITWDQLRYYIFYFQFHLIFLKENAYDFFVTWQTCCECGQDLQTCPICRSPINTRIKLYWAASFIGSICLYSLKLFMWLYKTLDQTFVSSVKHGISVCISCNPSLIIFPPFILVSDNNGLTT
jgi:hypothetical protein